MTENTDSTTSTASAGRLLDPLSRRRLFELGGATAVLAALLTACGGDDEAAPGRVGYAPVPTDLPDDEVDDAVYLRTLTSLEHSIIAIYQRFQSDAGLEGAAAAALDRFVDDHTATAEHLAELTVEAGGEPYECPNPWYEQRYFEQALLYIFGDQTTPTTIPVSDDVPRDALSMMYSLESMCTSSYLRFVELLSTSELRGQSATLGSQSARRAATTALITNPGPAGYVAPTLLAADGQAVASAPPESAMAAPIPTRYAINTRFAQLTAAALQLGAVNDLGLRYTTSFDTPAENAYIYNSMSC